MRLNRVTGGFLLILFFGLLLWYGFNIQSQIDQANEDRAKLTQYIFDLQEVIEGEPNITVPPLPSDIEPILPIFPSEDQLRLLIGDYLRQNPPEPGRAPTPAEIDAAVAAFCIGDRCRGPIGPTPTFDQIQTAVTVYLTENPPGRPPTDAEIIAAVGTFCASGACRGDQGPPGPALSDDQVLLAVTIYCDTHGQCRGPQGDPGRPPTDEEIQTAVTIFCNEHGECRGSQGEQGRPPTAAEILDAVTIFCSTRNDCIGPQGLQGRPPTATEIMSAVDAWFQTHTFICERQPGQIFTCTVAP